jgi:hypothetical protein
VKINIPPVADACLSMLGIEELGSGPSFVSPSGTVRAVEMDGLSLEVVIPDTAAILRFFGLCSSILCQLLRR